MLRTFVTMKTIKDRCDWDSHGREHLKDEKYKHIVILEGPDVVGVFCSWDCASDYACRVWGDCEERF